MPGAHYKNHCSSSTGSADFLLWRASVPTRRDLAAFQSAPLSIAPASHPPFSARSLKSGPHPRSWLPPFLLSLLFPSAPPRLSVESVPCTKRDFSGLEPELIPKFSEQTHKTFRDQSHFSNHTRRIAVGVGVPRLRRPLSCESRALPAAIRVNSWNSCLRAPRTTFNQPK